MLKKVMRVVFILFSLYGAIVAIQWLLKIGDLVTLLIKALFPDRYYRDLQRRVRENDRI